MEIDFIRDVPTCTMNKRQIADLIQSAITRLAHWHNKHAQEWSAEDEQVWSRLCVAKRELTGDTETQSAC